ncbi:iron chelate uptake ABC transporter family permease subunit [Streptomyces zaomyceticus]|uniref:iron chelate uptake ABC transporter family permease subunit n=1 Tax=Streptomyces zaomyceticus TaxID=68286 RepID=UPI001678BF0D|nr:iron chelate uptake ABC transporter family permease subunit [Streptomyces zaomyceticus]GHG25827.1 hypothetical protein GCM10018791_47080 [Streptomyces zaomyceticus]
MRAAPLWTVAGLAVLAVSVAVAITIGPADVGVADVWSVVAAHLGGEAAEVSPIRDGIVWDLRLPRTLLAAVCGAVLAAALLICGGHARTLDAFAFGEDAAAALGVAVARTRLVLLCVTALLAAALVSAAGAIGFVGLVLPHAARALAGPGHARLLPVTAVTGAVFLVWADTLARTVLDPQEVPVGVVTSLVGVPAFVLVLYRTRSTR